jgi:hypothetical protein
MAQDADTRIQELEKMVREAEERWKGHEQHEVSDMQKALAKRLKDVDVKREELRACKAQHQVPSPSPLFSCLLSKRLSSVFCPNACLLSSVQTPVFCLLSKRPSSVFCPNACLLSSVQTPVFCLLSKRLSSVFCPNACLLSSVQTPDET